MAQPQSQTLLGEFTAVLQTPSWWEGTPLPLPNNPTPQFWNVKTSSCKFVLRFATKMLHLVTVELSCRITLINNVRLSK